MKFSNLIFKLTIKPLRKNVTNYIENLIGEDTSISDELQTEGRWKESFFHHLLWFTFKILI